MTFSSDVDIDVSSKTKKGDFGIRAIIYDPAEETVRPHPSGHYLMSNMPTDPENNDCAAIDYEAAEKLGFLKVDLLTNTSYDTFESKAEVLKFAMAKPDWNLLLDENVVSKLPHIGKYGDLVRLLEPKSIEDLADILALIRPGKTKFLEEYQINKEAVRKNLYKRPKRGYSFKKSHAIATALMIVTTMGKLKDTNFWSTAK